MAVQKMSEIFRNFKYKLFSFAFILLSDTNDSDKNFSSDKIQQIDSSYLLVKNFKTISDQLNGKHFASKYYEISY